MDEPDDNIFKLAAILQVASCQN